MEHALSVHIEGQALEWSWNFEVEVLAIERTKAHEKGMLITSTVTALTKCLQKIYIINITYYSTKCTAWREHHHGFNSQEKQGLIKKVYLEFRSL